MTSKYEAENHYNKAKSDLAQSVQAMKMYGRALGMDIDDIGEDVREVVKLD